MRRPLLALVLASMSCSRRMASFADRRLSAAVAVTLMGVAAWPRIGEARRPRVHRPQVAVELGEPAFECPAATGLHGAIDLVVSVGSTGELRRYDFPNRRNRALRRAVRSCLLATWRQWRPATLEGRPIDHVWTLRVGVERASLVFVPR